MKSTFFYEGYYLEVAQKIKGYLNAVPDYLSEQTARSTRAAGDAIESLVADKFDKFLGDWCSEYSANFARRAMADAAFMDTEDFYCAVDVKTHREDTKFNMPNLTSVERLSRFYEDHKNVFALILVKYGVEGNKVTCAMRCNAPILSQGDTKDSRQDWPVQGSKESLGEERRYMGLTVASTRTGFSATLQSRPVTLSVMRTFDPEHAPYFVRSIAAFQVCGLWHEN